MRTTRIVSALAAAVMALSACSISRAVEAIDVLQDVAAGEGRSALKARTAPPRRQTMAYRIGAQARTGDLYLPGHAPAKAVIVALPGVVRDGQDDPRLVAFAQTLARAEFAVFVPDLPYLRTLAIGPQDGVAVAAAIQSIGAVAGFDGEPAVGVAAFSYAAGPAVIAALRDDTRDQVGFIFAVGPYYDAQAVVAFLTTGGYRRRPDAAWRSGRPSPYAKWIFVRGNAARLSQASDRRLIMTLSDRKLRNPDADVSDLVASLGAEGRAVYALLANTDPERVSGLISALPAEVRSDMFALDLKRRDLAALRAQLLLVHGRDDPLVPSTESRALAAAAPGKKSLFIIDSLRHVELGRAGPLDLLRLWRAAYILLELRDASPAPLAFAPTADLTETFDSLSPERAK